MSDANPGGQNLGSATGRIRIDVTQVAEAQRQVAAASRNISRSFEGINTGAMSSGRGLGIMTDSVRGLGATLGITFGAAAVGQLGRYLVAMDGVATAYRRQMVAARDLAGSQSTLNDLLRVYDEATGGAIDRATALADVTRLQAVGFADSAQELEQFVRAARGISVATGQQQDYVISQLQLAIANQSTLRLDQLGLGVSEVKARIDELKAANRGLTDEMAYQQAILGLAEQKFGKLTRTTEGQATGTERAEKAWKDLRLEMAQDISVNIDPATSALADLINWINQARDAKRDLNNELNDLGTERAREIQRGRGETPLRILTSGERRWIEDAGQRTAARRGRGGGAIGPTAEQNAAILEWSQARSEIERNAYQESLRATQQYEEQRSSTIRSYEQTIARDAQDFAVQRQRAEQDHAQALAEVREQVAAREAQQAEELARTIAQARRDSSDRLGDLQENLDRTLAQRRADSAERVGEWEEDHNKAIEERRKDGAARLLELEKDFAEDRARAQREYALSLEEAAARGDARAVHRLQQRFELEQEEAAKSHQERVTDEKAKLQEAIDQLNRAHRERLQDEQKALDKATRQATEAYDRQVADEKEALEERIAQANEAYARQLEDARLADEQRLADMQADFEERKRREDSDRATRLSRMATDHQEDLRTLDTEHGERLNQIKRHAAAERTELDEQAKADLLALDVRNAAWLGEQRSKEAELEKLWDEFWEHINGTLTNPLPVPSPIGDPTFDPRRQQLEADRVKRQKEQAQYEFGSPEWNTKQIEIDAIEAELKRLGWTPPTSGPSMAMATGASAMMANARFTTPAPMPAVAASASGGGAGGFSIGSLSVVVHGAPTDSPRDFADQFRRELLTTLRDVKGQM